MWLRLDLYCDDYLYFTVITITMHFNNIFFIYVNYILRKHEEYVCFNSCKFEAKIVQFYKTISLKEKEKTKYLMFIYYLI